MVEYKTVEGFNKKTAGMRAWRETDTNQWRLEDANGWMCAEAEITTKRTMREDLSGAKAFRFYTESHIRVHLRVAYRREVVFELVRTEAEVATVRWLMEWYATGYMAEEARFRVDTLALTEVDALRRYNLQDQAMKLKDGEWVFDTTTYLVSMMVELSRLGKGHSEDRLVFGL